MDKKGTLPSPCFLEGKNHESSHFQSLKSVLMPGLIPSGLSNQSKCKKKDEFLSPPSRQISLRKNISGKEKLTATHFSSPQGMLMPSHMQPPPMYGPRGPTIPPKYMNKNNNNLQCHRNYWCENCDEELQSSSDLERHKSEHKTCSIDGCSFTANPEIIANHINQTHNSGIYSKIKKLSTPEEIAKWREERRKSYPTRANIELRRKAQEEKLKRGEKIAVKNTRFGNKQDRRHTRNTEHLDQRIVLRKPRENKCIFKARNNAIKTKERISKIMENIKAKQMNSENDQNCIGKLQQFRGTSILEKYSRPKKKVAIQSNPLASLLGMYGSDEESTSDNETESDDGIDDDSYSVMCTETRESQVDIEKQVDLMCSEEKSCDNGEKLERKDQNLKGLSNQQQNTSNSDDDMPEEAPIQKESNLMITHAQEENSRQQGECKEGSAEQKTFPPRNTKYRNSKKRQRIRRNDKMRETIRKLPKTGLLDYSKCKTRRQNTMLEKLLESDIIHERNVLLQCVRFVVQNNFFGIGDKKCI